MKINIRRIPSEGLKVVEHITPESIDLNPQDIGLVSDLNVDAFVKKIDNFVLITANVEASYQYTCGRCLEDQTLKVTDVFDIEIEVEHGQETIDLGEEIRQELIIGHNQWYLCDTDDQGNCIQQNNIIKKL